jgi:microcystin degradation protein MlrC
MRKIHPIPTNVRKYKATPQVDVDELATKWVEMMIEMLMTKETGGLQKTDLIPKLDTAWFPSFYDRNTKKINENEHTR